MTFSYGCEKEKLVEAASPVVEAFEVTAKRCAHYEAMGDDPDGESERPDSRPGRGLLDEANLYQRRLRE